MVISMDQKDNKMVVHWTVIFILVIIISVLPYTTPTMKWQYHLVYMQSYFIPILIAAFQFGIRGGLGVAIAVSIVYLPHIMLQWGGLVENNLMRFMQIVLYNIIGFLTGLKAQKEKEEKTKFKGTADELEKSLQTVREQSNKLHESEEQLRQADRLAVVGELTASLAHDVRNPLGSIRGAVEILRDGVQDENKKMEFFQILINDTERLNSVLENYLNYSKRKKQRDSEYIFQELVQNISMMLNTQARKNGIEIAFEMPGDPIKMKGDPDDLWQVLMNLILNSIQAMINGGKIKINVRREEITSEKKIENYVNDKSGSYIILTISDTGPGISEKDSKEIFKPFFTKKASGTGLGLAIVKRIVDNNHWIMNFSSELGSGTEFVILIPERIKK